MLKSQKIIFQSLGILIFIAILIFSYSGYRRHRKGPEIIHINLQKFMETQKPSLKLQAQLKNVQSVRINERNIIIKNDKKINEILVFSPGDNIIEIGLTDPFGKKKIYLYHIFYRDRKYTYPQTLKEAQKIQKEQASENELTVNKQ